MYLKGFFAKNFKDLLSLNILLVNLHVVEVLILMMSSKYNEIQYVFLHCVIFWYATTRICLQSNLKLVSKADLYRIVAATLFMNLI